MEENGGRNLSELKKVMRSLCSTGFFQKILFSYFLMNNEKLLGCVRACSEGGVGCRREKREGGGAGNFSFNISCHSWTWII